MTRFLRFTRRTLLKAAAAGGASLALGPTLQACASDPGGAATPSAGQALRFPAKLEGSTLVATSASAEITPGASVPVWTYGGTYPAPTIVAKRGDMFEVALQNDLAEATNVHWHGLATPADMDGHPRDPVAPGASRTYRFRVDQRAGTYWYHPHTHETAAKQAYLGMAGFFVVTDDAEAAIGLPAGDLDVPFVIQDRRFQSGRIEYQETATDRMDGYLGEAIFVNGAPGCYHEVEQSLYRFRILNGSNARVFRLAFADERTFHIIGTDGGLLDAPVAATDVWLASGERVELLVDFARDALGSSLTLQSLEFTVGHGGHPVGAAIPPQGMAFDILRFDVKRAASVAKREVPATLAPIERMDAASAVRTRTFELTADHAATKGIHKINGKLFELDRIDEEVPLGDVEIWELKNSDHMALHPMHVHGAQFQVLSRTGAALNTDRGWKDTVLVFPLETVRILVRFVAHRGVYLLHCHTLEHEADGMMINVEVR